MPKLLWNMMISAAVLFILTGNGHAQATAIAEKPVYKFDFQLVPIDAQTKGKITTTTKQVELGVLITNHSTNVKPGTGVYFKFSDSRLVSGRGLQIAKLESNNGFGTSSGLKSLYKNFIFSNVAPTVLTKPLPKDLIAASLKIKVIIYGPPGSPVPTEAEFDYDVEDVSYLFDNCGNIGIK